jgi:hypothetical protein
MTTQKNQVKKRRHPEEVKKKISRSLEGRPKSAATRKRMSEARYAYLSRRKMYNP